MLRNGDASRGFFLTCFRFFEKESISESCRVEKKRALFFLTLGKGPSLTLREGLVSNRGPYYAVVAQLDRASAF